MFSLTIGRLEWDILGNGTESVVTQSCRFTFQFCRQPAVSPSPPSTFHSFWISEFTISDVQMWPIFISSFILRYRDCSSLSIIHRVKESEREEISCCVHYLWLNMGLNVLNRGDGKCILKIKSRKMNWCWSEAGITNGWRYDEVTVFRLHTNLLCCVCRLF